MSTGVSLDMAFYGTSGGVDYRAYYIERDKEIMKTWTLEQIQEMYLDYFNNFLTVGVFAEHYGITKEQALGIISIGQSLMEPGV